MQVPITRDLIEELLSEIAEDDLEYLRFGASQHKYKLNPPISSEAVHQFERQKNFFLPPGYTHFLTMVGNGGAGPGLCLLPLGMALDGPEIVPWDTLEVTGDPSQIFLYSKSWNLPNSFWKLEPTGETPNAEVMERLSSEEWSQELKRNYFSPTIMNGAIPLCYRGDGLMTWLVVTGEQSGYVWEDNRAIREGLSPVRNEIGEQMTFLDWYYDWIIQTMFQPRTEPFLRNQGNQHRTISERFFGPTLTFSIGIGMALGIFSTSPNQGSVSSAISMFGSAFCFGLSTYGILIFIDRWFLKTQIDFSEDPADGDNLK